MKDSQLRRGHRTPTTGLAGHLLRERASSISNYCKRRALARRFVEMPPNRTTPDVPATRLACDRCHDHKLRCDRSPITGEPCRRCARVKADCKYGRPRRFGRPRKRRDSVKEDSTGACPATPAPLALESAAPPPRELMTRNDSSVAGIDSPAFFEVDDSSFGKQPASMSMLPGNVESFSLGPGRGGNESTISVLTTS